MDKRQAEELAEIALAEAAQRDIRKKRELLEEFITEASRKGTADPDRICFLIEEFLDKEGRGMCPAFIQILEDGPGLAEGATRVRDLMIDALRNGEDLTLMHAVSICEELAARLVYR